MERGTRRFYDVSLALYLVSDEDDLLELTDYLKDLEKTHIYHLGLVLGLRKNRVKTMMDSGVPGRCHCCMAPKGG